MQLDFQYNLNKDIWCLLNKGKGSNNSSKPTKVYEQLVAMFGDQPTEEETHLFIEKYLKDNHINTQDCIESYQADWEEIQEKFQNKAENIFNVTLPSPITVYLTVNTRCPYNIEEKYFYVSMSSGTIREIAMHELWHFYTWYKFGPAQEKIGKERYNDLKEALTALLNVECRDLFPSGTEDKGYPQHQGLRQEVLIFWEQNRDIEALWENIARD